MGHRLSEAAAQHRHCPAPQPPQTDGAPVTPKLKQPATQADITVECLSGWQPAEHPELCNEQHDCIIAVVIKYMIFILLCKEQHNGATCC